MNRWARRTLLTAAAASILCSASPVSSRADGPRPFPDSAARILVLDDQLDLSNATDAQVRFAATHYVGTQKVVARDARRLRAYNPDFLVLHYRLGQAIGHSMPRNGCQPGGEPISIVDGDRWIPEWPGDDRLPESWFYHWNGARVFNCEFGHYLMDLDDPGYRAWWVGEVIGQLQRNDDDAIFADSFSIPSYFGPQAWQPSLPVVDAAFEADWARREHEFTDYVEAQLAGRWKWIPNVGALVTTRDPSDYSKVDGVMIEGFATWGGNSYFDPGDWQLQMNRVLALARADKIVVAQTYPDAAAVDQRLFALGSYLLVKGAHSYVNLEVSAAPDWFPEYGIDLGAPLDPLPQAVDSFLDTASGLYVRHFQNGEVVVNPTRTVRHLDLGTTLYLAQPLGGGDVPPDGSAPGSVTYTAVGAATIGAHQAAILLNAPA